MLKTIQQAKSIENKISFHTNVKNILSAFGLMFSREHKMYSTNNMFSSMFYSSFKSSYVEGSSEAMS